MAPKHSRGVALLTVLFILVLLTTMSVYMVEDEHMALRRISNQRELEQSYQAATASEQWAMKILERDLLDNEFDHLDEDWNKLDEGGGVKVEDGALKTTVVDQQGLFNINNLQKAISIQEGNSEPQKSEWFLAFERLLDQLKLDRNLVYAVVDWIDNPPNGDGPLFQSSYGAEDSDYQLFDPPYRAANQLFNDVSELLLVKGFGHKELSVLSQYITALPVDENEVTQINVNTSPAEVLRTLSPTLQEQQFDQILVTRLETPFQTTEEFMQAIDPANSPQEDQMIKSMITVESGFFSVRSDAQFGRILFKLESLVERKKETEVARVIRRRRGLS
jgi:general secretion pathway protein K